MSRGDSFSDSELQSVVDAYQENGKNKLAAARTLGLTETSYRRRLEAAAERGMLPLDPVLPGFVITSVSERQNADGGVTSRNIRQEPDPGEKPEFTLPVGHVIKGVSALLDPDNRVSAQWVKTKIDDVTPYLIEAIKQTFSEYQGIIPLIPPPALADANLLSIYPIADQHNGLLAWGRETGEAYDLKIGIERLRSCMARLVAQSPSSKTAIILNLGDWQHNDDSSNETPAHHNKLDVDSRYRKILLAGVQLMRDCIELALQKHEHVIVVNIPGNHDPHAAVALDIAIMSAYENNPRLTVGEMTADFYFHRFGSTLIGSTHGHKVKKHQDMAMAMAVRCREDWGKTKYHYFYFGHIHHETMKEVGDVRVESFQTLAANDAHHAASGYTSGKSLTSITIDKDGGEIGRHRVNIPAPDYKANITQGSA